MGWKNVWLGVVTLALLSSGAGAADQTAGTPANPVLPEVVVTASRVEEPERDLTIPMTVIDQEAIARSTARDVGDLLAEQGFAVRKYPGTLTSVGIRGFRTETHGNDLKGYVLILLDGRRAGTGNVAKLLTENVERIEVIRGPAAVQYGSAAVGGVVNIITKKGVPGKAQAYAEAGMGSWDEQQFALGLSGGQHMLDFSGSFAYTSQDDFDTANGDRYPNTGIDQLIHGSLNAGWTFLNNHRLGIIFTGMAADEAGSSNYFSNPDLDDYSDKSNYSFDVNYTGRTGSDAASWMVRYFNGQDKDLWADPLASNPDYWDDGEDSERRTDLQGAQGQFSLNFGQSRITAGIDWVNYEVTATWSPEETTYENTAGFLLGKTHLLDKRLILDAGLRYDTFTVEVVQPAGRSEDDTHLSPSAGLAFFPLNWLKLRTSYGQAFVMPEADQLAADYSVWGRRYVGNPELQPETSQTFDGGFDIFYGAWRAGLTLFHTDFEDKIQSVSLPDGSQSWDNIGDATVAGWEGDLSVDLGELLHWAFQLQPYVRFTYLSQYEDDSTGQDLLYTPDWQTALGIILADADDDLSANISVTYFGDQTVEDWESGLWPAPEVTLDGYTVTDLSLTKRLASFNQWGRLKVNGQIRNLFDESYQSVKGYPMPGRSFFLGLRYEY